MKYNYRFHRKYINLYVNAGYIKIKILDWLHKVAYIYITYMFLSDMRTPDISIVQLSLCQLKKEPDAIDLFLSQTCDVQKKLIE